MMKMRALAYFAVAFTVGAAIFQPHAAWSATSGLALEPGRMELEVKTGTQRTAAFVIESPPSSDVVSGRLLLNATDWALNDDGEISYLDVGASMDSATPWITFSPTALTISSGQRSLVRVTITVPKDAAPGTYRSGIFVQERPPAALPKPGEHTLLFRFRYVELIYVIVPPVSAAPHLLDAAIQAGKQPSILFRMRNDGTALVRPYLGWTLKNRFGEIVAQEKLRETTVLLPKANLNEAIPFTSVPPGDYELTVTADFQNGLPVQAIVRKVEIAPVESGTK